MRVKVNTPDDKIWDIKSSNLISLHSGAILTEASNNEPTLGNLIASKKLPCMVLLELYQIL